MSKYAITGSYVDVVNRKVIRDGAVLVDDKKIIYAGEKSGAGIDDDFQIIEAGGGMILPGFIDCQCPY